MKFEMAIDIGVSPRELWPWLTEPARMKQWMKGLESLEPSDPAAPHRAGATAKMVIKEGGRLATYDETILAYEPYRRVAVAMTGAHCPGIEMRCTNQLDDLGATTRLHYTFECVTKRTLFRILGPIFGVFARLQAKSFFRTLKRLAEESGSGAVRALTGA